MLLECFYDYQTSEIGYQTEFTWKSNEFFILLSYTIKLTYVYWIVKSMRNDFYFFCKTQCFYKACALATYPHSKHRNYKPNFPSTSCK